MPSSFLIDRDGNLVHAHKGFKTNDGSRMEDMIRDLLDNKK
jgi:peroxiredoxin